MTAYRLTPKQEKFCAVYLVTGNASEAYRQAYSTENMAPATINRCAHELLKHPNISARVNRAKERIVEAVVYDKAKAIEYSLEILKEAREAMQFGAAVSANRLAADIAGHIVDRKDVTVRSVKDMPTDELKAELAELKRELGADATRH